MAFNPLLTVLPEKAAQKSVGAVLTDLYNAFGAELEHALDPEQTIASPLAHHADTQWLKTANTVGVNVRTLGSFFHLVPYSMTLPSAQQAIHILPVFEPGVVASLYGPCSWQVNPEFFNAELAAAFPPLNTVEKQLKVVINLLHLMGRTVGMDVIPHTDRFSEQVLANPHLFEWLQRADDRIVRHDDDLLNDVQAEIVRFLLENGPAVALEIPSDISPTLFFEQWEEAARLRMLFGEPHDHWGRLARRKQLLQRLFESGFETVPATMGPPYRGLEVDPDPAAVVEDEEGRRWRDYRITQPERMSRVFGPLTRYKLYHSQDQNRDWRLDFTQPHVPAWEYVCAHYRAFQAQYNFDFMRGDMSHVQMRPAGVPTQPDAYYDVLGAVKQAIVPEKPYFGYFAESFLAPPNTMAYGDECDHLEASFADSTLGDLQSEPVGTAAFVQTFAQYRYWLENRAFAPNFTILTADKDDPRFDKFYLAGNEIRHFLALFLTDMPSYMGLGFESRDVHPVPAPNEQYTKLYVFHLDEGPKGTHGPYQWGQNHALYARLVWQKELSEHIGASIADQRVRWLIPPDATGQQKILSWTQAEQPQYLFVANLDTDHAVPLTLPMPAQTLIFSTHQGPLRRDAAAAVSIAAGEGLVFAI